MHMSKISSRYCYKKIEKLQVLIAVILVSISPDYAHVKEYIYQENQIKASYLIRLADYITWPQQVEMKGYVNICIYGEHPVGSHAKQLENSVINSIALRITNNVSFQTINQCNIVYVGSGQEEDFLTNNSTGILDHVLIVGEGYQHIDNGGMLALCISKNKVRVVINEKKINDSDIKISSKILRVADLVK